MSMVLSPPVCGHLLEQPQEMHTPRPPARRQGPSPVGQEGRRAFRRAFKNSTVVLLCNNAEHRESLPGTTPLLFRIPTL